MKQAPFWSEAEDRRLIAARTLSVDWETLVQTYLPGRTAHAAKTRYATLRAKDARLETPAPAGSFAGADARAPYLTRGTIPDAEPQDHVNFLIAAARKEAEACSDAIRERTAALYEREAERRGTSPDLVMLSMQRGPEAAAAWARHVA